MIVFLTLYVAVSAMIGDFYKMPIAVALTAASAWGIGVVMRGGLSDRIGVFSRAAGHSDILYMIWIFVLAGAFASMAKEIGAVDATVALTLRVFPPQLLLPGMFLAACFISLSVGTSVGTVVALAPLAAEMAGAAGAPTAMYVAAVIGGAFFGDNLSFISDTTIAATQTQGCSMRDKFAANIRLVLPAAVATCVIYLLSGIDAGSIGIAADVDPAKVIPYMIVIAAAICGVNVLLVLIAGIASAGAIGMIDGSFDIVGLFAAMGGGIQSMCELIIVTMIAGGLLETVRTNGGIDYLVGMLTRRISGRRGAEAAIVSLTALANVCTANNTIAILTAGDISRDISARFGIAPQRSASLMDTASCFVQGIIPYGAQLLMASGLASVSPLAIIPNLYYPVCIGIAVVLSILLRRR